MKIVSFLLLFIVQFSFSQEIKELKTTPLDADLFIGFDVYNNLYYVKDMTLFKKGSKGDYVYNDFELGEIASVDIINPLNIVIFFKDTNTVVLVDNRLAEIERFSFNNLPGFINVAAARNAGNNRLWLFNSDSQQVELYNYRTKERIPISQPISGDVMTFTSNFNYCYLATDTMFRIYNTYGGIVQTISINGITNSSQYNESLMVTDSKNLFYLKRGALEFNNIKTPTIPISNLQLTQDFLYIYHNNIVHTFTLTQPKK
ncbi:hypothetical protein ACFQO1_02480 [Jejudonia soesokkakensis]|uniref:Uncharacterized protein n=1 Tax=Jejudonia soesokkakensis TaxID=1323432 RepID=A0ABW2MTB9_9FLAO